VIGVDNLDASIANVTAAGGEVLGGKMDIPGIGIFARCKDTEGNFFSMLQPQS
jgi:predicted enzyme related to lactoylglutathione lyase